MRCIALLAEGTSGEARKAIGPVAPRRQRSLTTTKEQTMHFHNLDNDTRRLMSQELARDINDDNVYLSTRLTEYGKSRWTHILGGVFSLGSTDLLAECLGAAGVLETSETYTRAGQTKRRAMPKNAADTLAHGEFNRYYMRALCLQALADPFRSLALEVCRVKQVQSPREESQARIGDQVDPAEMLSYLRQVPGREHPESPDFSWLRRPFTGLGLRLVRVAPQVRLVERAPDGSVPADGSPVFGGIPADGAAGFGAVPAGGVRSAGSPVGLAADPLAVSAPSVRVIDESDGTNTVLRIISDGPVKIVVGADPCDPAASDLPTVWLRSA